MHKTVATLLMTSGLLLGGRTSAESPKLPLLVSENFERGAERWQPTDSTAWKVKKDGERTVYSQFKKRSKYEPPHRSPYNISLLKDVYASDFLLDAKVLSTHEDYGHRDVCLFFGYQDPAHFYYVHLGKKTDDHANQIFIVNDKPRTKISSKTTPGTNWDDQWHHVRIRRHAKDGSIAVFFDDMETPIMEANDTTFARGQIGIGSFDDTGDWDSIELRGVKVEKP
ncbi:MAG: hypothetical protein CMJ64_20535 [Planctomycetaceae bacterium]|nr:hypothetical protein [Planctomycetaceae bacterium]